MGGGEREGRERRWEGERERERERERAREREKALSQLKQIAVIIVKHKTFHANGI